MKQLVESATVIDPVASAQDIMLSLVDEQLDPERNRETPIVTDGRDLTNLSMFGGFDPGKEEAPHFILSSLKQALMDGRVDLGLSCFAWTHKDLELCIRIMPGFRSGHEDTSVWIVTSAPAM